MAHRILTINEVNTIQPNFAIAPTQATSGLYQMEDDNGTSYYFRGNVTDNYVQFANILWRIVRINGDGSIRLITDSIVADKSFASWQSNLENAVRYTYNTPHDCTIDTPCYEGDGTASPIKKYLEQSWYSSTINSTLENMLTTSSFCNDLSNDGEGQQYDYGAYSRISGGEPNLKCPLGKYILKVGLLSADELMLAGITYGNYSNSLTYLRPSQSFWSMSPSYVSSSNSEARMLYSYQDGGIAEGLVQNYDEIMIR